MAEHVHELRMIRDWSGGIVAKCDIQGCRKTLGIMEVNRRLNATERLSVKLVREELGCYAPGWTGWDKLRIAAWEYADILEGKPHVARSFNETGADADFRVESKNNMEGEDD